jgi:predicted 3-demethylubiquinone-9 3-methyltransferase (glyoxalase superfamily)
MAESAHTHLMFQNGRALEAIRRYEEIFDGGVTIDGLDLYSEAASGPTGQVQLAVFTLLGQRITCIDSPIEHDFDMTPAISLFVECGDEDELERLFVALAENGKVFMPLDDYGFSRRYGWVQDRFGVPWQLNLR